VDTGIKETMPELKRLCLHYRDEENKIVVLDFSGVTFIEMKGMRMLEGIKDERIRIVNCSPFIDSLLGSLIINK
jgi:anti-anti-sigma regulatory factor